MLSRPTVPGLALVLLISGCSGTGATTTTEPLATSLTSTEAPTSSTAAPVTSAAPGLNADQQDTLDALLAAHAAGDIVGLMSLWGSSGDHFRPDIQFDIDMGGQWSDVTCDDGSAGRVRCQLLYTNELLTAVGAPPLDGFFWIQMSESGVINDWRYSSGNDVTMSAYLEPFSEWVRANDPESAEQMFTFDGFIMPTPPSYAVWVEKVDEYLRDLG